VVQWEGFVDVDPDAVMAEHSKKKRDPNKVEKCAEFIAEFLKEFAYPSTEIEAAAVAAGFTKDNVHKAKTKLRYDKDKNLWFTNQLTGFQGIFWNGLGKPETWKLRPTPAEAGAGAEGEAAETPQAPKSPKTPQAPKSPKSPNNGQGEIAFREAPGDQESPKTPESPKSPKSPNNGQPEAAQTCETCETYGPGGSWETCEPSGDTAPPAGAEEGELL
jgi:hypothetical protein